MTETLQVHFLQSLKKQNRIGHCTLIAPLQIKRHCIMQYNMNSVATTIMDKSTVDARANEA